MDDDNLTAVSRSDDPEVRRLSDERSIQNLIAIYSLARDNHELSRLVSLFTNDGSFALQGQTVSGHEALREFYARNMARYRTSLHVTHSQLIDVAGAHARGLVSGHAELALEEGLMIAAYRYEDAYVQDADRWRFDARRLLFMYAVPADEMVSSFQTDLRMRWPGVPPAAADFPESFPSFSEPS